MTLQNRKIPLVLAHGGMPCVNIKTKVNASATEEYASEELRRHLLGMLGLQPLIRTASADASSIFINDSDAAKADGIDLESLSLKPDMFHLEKCGRNLHILGGNDRGVLYGAYELLESLGCRWFTPEISRIPRYRNISFKTLRKTGRPAFEFRDMFCWECRDPVWWVRNRMNGWYTPVPEHMGGHMTYGDGMFVHTFNTLVSPDKYFSNHPEYFSMINGIRTGVRSQLCLTNPEVLGIVVDEVLGRMRANPKASIFSVSQNDWRGYCECPRCRAVAGEEGSQSGAIIRFVNDVAKETSKIYPGKLIDTLAYMYSLDAPRIVKPHPNVRMRICPIRCCQGHGFGSCNHPESIRFMKAMSEWSKRTSQIYIWHYCTNFAHYPLPMPDFDEIQGNIRLYRRHGMYGVFMQGMGEDGGGAESMALRGYVISKLLWNPDRSVWPLVDEFLAAYYGAAAPDIRTYLNFFHGYVRKHRDVHPSLFDPPSHVLFDERLLAKADMALAAGESHVREPERGRIRLLKHGLAYARIIRNIGVFRRNGNWYHGNSDRNGFRIFERMVRDWKNAGIQCVKEATPIEHTAQLQLKQLRKHRVFWLRDNIQKIAVVPSLGGRLLEWNAFGHQWLAAPLMENPWSPMCEGYQESVLDMHRGWFETYECRGDSRSMILNAKVTETVGMSRRYTLRQGRLHILSQVINKGDAPQKVSWFGALHMIPPSGNVEISFQTSEGDQQQHLWDQMKDGYASFLKLEGKFLPAGSWCVTASGLKLIHEFGPAVTQAILFKIEAQGMLGLDINSSFVMLEPKGTIMVEQTISISEAT